MPPAEDSRFAEALDWVRRVADPGFDDWEGHLAWLERDAANAPAFDDASMLIEEASAGLAPSHSAPSDDLAPRRRARGWLAAAVTALAASLVAIVAWPDHAAKERATSTVATVAGQSRAFALPDGTRISLNGDTVLLVDRTNPRHIRLDRGQAFFRVVHDARHPFSVAIGDDEVTDVGTAFDIRRDGGGTVVAVQEGAVLYRSGGQSRELRRGMAMRLSDGVRLTSSVDPAAVGGWAAGRLTYHDAPLAVVAGDLSRIVGAPVTVAHQLDNRRISGVFFTEADHGRTMRRFGRLFGIDIRQDGTAWRMSPPTQ